MPHSLIPAIEMTRGYGDARRLGRLGTLCLLDASLLLWGEVSRLTSHDAQRDPGDRGTQGNDPRRLDARLDARRIDARASTQAQLSMAARSQKKIKTARG